VSTAKLDRKKPKKPKPITREDIDRDFGHWSKHTRCGWGHGEGWNGLIYDLCVDLRNILNAYKVSEKQLVVAQVKEKFGGLRFYYDLVIYDDEGNELPELPDGLDDDIEKAVRWAEYAAETTCEVCGQYGKVRRGGWLVCLCEKCNWRRIVGPPWYKKIYRAIRGKYSNLKWKYITGPRYKRDLKKRDPEMYKRLYGSK